MASLWASLFVITLIITVFASAVVGLEPGEWSFDNACISFDSRGVASLWSSTTEAIHLPPFFTEFGNFVRDNHGGKFEGPQSFVERPTVEEPKPRPSTCSSDPLSSRLFLLTGSSWVNLYHCMRHLIPIYEHFTALEGRGVSEQQWTVLPDQPANTFAQPPAAVLREPSFNFTLRALGLEPSAARYERALALMAPGRCTCFEHIHGGSGAWEFSDPGAPRRLRRLADSLDANPALSRTVVAPKNEVLVVLRPAGRARRILNEAELQTGPLGAALAAELEALSWKVRFVRLEDLSVEEQYARVRSARILVGNHGQSNVWAAFLPTGGGAAGCCALVELYADAALESRVPIHYRLWAEASAATYVPLAQETSPECVGWEMRECGDIVAASSELFEQAF